MTKSLVSSDSISKGFAHDVGRLCLIPCALAATTSISNAFEVRPLIHNLEPLGRQSSSTFTVGNPSDQPLPIEVSISQRAFDADGNESLVAADGDFLVFPPSVVIPSGGSQSLRIQWLGNPEISESQSYYAQVTQLPIDLTEDADSQLQFILAFNVAVHVSPTNSEAVLEVIDADLRSDDDGTTFLDATLENSGARYSYASNLTITVASPRQAQVFKPADILALDMETLLPPDSVRHLRLPLGDGDWSGPLTVDLQLLEAR